MTTTTDQFVRTVANLIMDGEPSGNGWPFEMENDDAYETLHSLIRQARQLLAEGATR